jgi:hypothetical protein
MALDYIESMRHDIVMALHYVGSTRHGILMTFDYIGSARHDIVMTLVASWRLPFRRRDRLVAQWRCPLGVERWRELEPLFAVLRAKVVGHPVIRGLRYGMLRINFHAAYRIGCHVFCSFGSFRGPCRMPDHAMARRTLVQPPVVGFGAAREGRSLRARCVATRHAARRATAYTPPLRVCAEPARCLAGVCLETRGDVARPLSRTY